MLKFIKNIFVVSLCLIAILLAHLYIFFPIASKRNKVQFLKMYGSHTAFLSFRKKFNVDNWSLPIKFYHANSNMTLDLASLGKNDVALFLLREGKDPYKILERYGESFYVKKIETGQINMMGNKAFQKKCSKITLTSNDLKRLMRDSSIIWLFTHPGSGTLISSWKKLGVPMKNIVQEHALFLSKQQFHKKLKEKAECSIPMIFFCNTVYIKYIKNEKLLEKISWTSYQWFDGPRINVYVAINRSSPYFEQVISNISEEE